VTTRAGTSAVVAVLGAAGLLLVLVTWAASIGPDRVLSGGEVEPVEVSDPPPPTQTADTDDPVEEERHKERGDPPDWVGIVAFVLEVLTICVGLFLVYRLLRRLRESWLSWRRRRRRRRVPDEVEFEVLDSTARVTRAIEEDAAGQRDQLAERGEPRNAIVACWHRFEQRATDAGAIRHPWQTTAEFVLAVLDLIGADRGAVAELADLYREARFSDHPITEQHRRAALEALDTIHASLRTRMVV
jgi:hypothetical protein